MATPPPDAQLLPYIDDLITATKAHKIEWVSANPTVYVWDIPNRARTTLQQAITARAQQGHPPSQIKIYIFQVLDMARGSTPRISTQSPVDTPVGQKLDELFATIAEGINQSNLDFLKSLVPR